LLALNCPDCLGLTPNCPDWLGLKGKWPDPWLKPISNCPEP